MANTTLGYESAYTGEEIDAAVGAVLGNGTTTPSLPSQVADNTSAIESLEGRMSAAEGGIEGSGLAIEGLQSLASSGYRIAGFVSPANTWLMRAVNMTCYFVMNPTARSWHVESGATVGVEGLCYLPPASYTPGSSAPESVDGWTAVDISGRTSQGIPVLFAYRNGVWVTHPLPYSINEGQTVGLKDTLDPSDLALTDESGNVLAMFSGGHIKVRHFDSSSLDGRIDDAVEVALEGATGLETRTNMESSDLCLTDEAGNILARFSGGHIETRGFNSRTGRNVRATESYRFQVDVECGNPVLSSWATATGLNDYTGKKVYADNCVLKLPLSYTPSGVATKLIIYCKQGGSQVTEDSDVVGQNVFPYLLHLGYAVLAVDGMPDGLTEELRLDDTRVVGNYAAVASVKAAYDYVMANWNLDKRGAFIWGYSQGGHYAQNVIDLSGIHFYAAAELSPVCSMRYHQWDLNVSKTIDSVSWTRVARLNIARLFGFPQVSTNEDLLALEYDADKVAGYDPWTRNVDEPFTGFTKVGNLWRLPSGTSLDSIGMRKRLQCPLKIWCAENDSTLSPDVMKVFVKAVKNAGQLADMHVYSTGGHGLYASQTAIGTFSYNGTTYNLYPLALEVAVWYSRFGGYAVDFESNNN